MLPCALLVDVEHNRLEALRRWIGALVELTTCGSFETARQQLLTSGPTLLISHLRLGAYNGLHLVHLAKFWGLETRCLVYDEPGDPSAIREAQRIGAFYERTSRLGFAVPAYLQDSLPEQDRRAALSLDRRGLFRGGRRSTDLSTDQIRATGPLSH